MASDFASSLRSFAAGEEALRYLGAFFLAPSQAGAVAAVSDLHSQRCTWRQLRLRVLDQFASKRSRPVLPSE